MKKRFIPAVGLLLLIITLLTGCATGSFVTKGSVERNSKNRMSMSYSYFNGYKETTFNVDEGTTVVVNVKIESSEGTLSAYIAKDNNKDNAEYVGNDIQTSEFSVTITDPGTYTIRVDGEKHKGSYDFQWNTK